MHDTGIQTRPAVFLDRDGTLNEEVNYLHRIEDFAWIPGAPEAIRRLNEAGFLTIVVTNQAGVARGYYTEEDVHRLHRYMQESLARYHAHIDAFYYSPYHPSGVVERYRGETSCRKPGTKLFRRAIEDWQIETQRSFVIGDKNSDIEPGLELGMRTILVETGYGMAEKPVTRATFIEKDIGAAVSRIMMLCSTTP